MRPSPSVSSRPARTPVQAAFSSDSRPYRRPNRNTPADNAIVGTQARPEIYLPAFQGAVQHGAASSMMCSYSTVSGTYAGERGP